MIGKDTNLEIVSLFENQLRFKYPYRNFIHYNYVLIVETGKFAKTFKR